MNENDLERRITEISSASYKMGIKHERERIIALLEAEIVEVGKDDTFLWEPQAIIALIRGE